jgi:predicted PolB exonuclease-like 3'-5' exonuclease
MIKALDIETIPNVDLIPSLPEPEVALGNTKDPDKIREKIEEAKKKQIEKMALNPFYARICSFSIYSESEKFYHTINDSKDSEEIELLNLLLKIISIGQDDPTVLLTWNGFDFDLPMIYKRSALLRVEKPQYCPSLSYWNRKYRHDTHIDLMRELNNWEGHGNNLDEAGRLFLGSGKTKRDYSTYVDLIKTGQSNLIGIDNLCDTELTYGIYKIVEPYLF